MVQVRYRRRGATARAVARRSGLCRRWASGAAGDVEDRERRRQIAWPDEVILISPSRLPRRCGSRYGLDCGSYHADRCLGLTAQPVPFRKPGGIIVRKPRIARCVLPNQRLQRQVDSNGSESIASAACRLWRCRRSRPRSAAATARLLTHRRHDRYEQTPSLALTAASSRFIVSCGPKLLGIVVSASAAIARSMAIRLR